MDRHKLCRFVAGVLILLIGAASASGAAVLLKEQPAADAAADGDTIQITAAAVLIVAVALVASGIAVLTHRRWGRIAGTISLLLFVVAGFGANYVLFGDVRPMHTGTNLVIALLVLWLLRIGYSGPK